ncbi:MAG: hypothetical protein H6835_19365 [Planctomycetes bacterium]|nr:hypothetical protein [Planctomycetota bacterium]
MSGDAFEDDFPADFDHDLVQSDERLADYVDGRLGERDRERFEAELRVSPQLREHLAEYQRTVAVLQQALRAPTHPTHLADRVMANLAAAATRPSVVQRKLRPLLFAAASAAALLALALVVDRLGAPASQHRSDFAKVDGDDAPPPPVVSPRPPGADGSWQPLDELLGRGAPSKADRPASETEEVEGSAAVPGEVLRLEQQQAPAADGAAVGEPAPAPGLPTPGAAAPRSVENGSVENGSVEKGSEKLGRRLRRSCLAPRLRGLRRTTSRRSR